MTLYRQIALLFTMGYLVVMLMLGWNDFNKSTQMMRGQMQTAAQDMATTAGIAISTLLQNDDAIAINTVFNAIFDSGYYTRLQLVSPDGEVLASRSQDVRVPEVPEWFVSLLPIEAARGETHINNGWLPYGTLTVTLHPGYAYARLYDNLKSLLIWLFVLASIGMAVLWLVLYRLLTPLRNTVAQADAICENRFIRQSSLPRTRELRHVVEAMNRMVGKVETLWHEQAATLRHFHDVQYRDELTGLGNRRHFTTRLDEFCCEAHKADNWLAIIYIHNLADLNKYLGYHDTNALLKTLAESLQGYPLIARGGECARINSSELAVLLVGDRIRIDEFVEWLFSSFRRQLQNRNAGEVSWLALGITELTDQCRASEVMATVDFALARARASGPYSVQYGILDGYANLPQGKLAWRDCLREALERDAFFLAGQDVLNSQGERFHHELFVRLQMADGKVVPAGTFMPIAAMMDLDYTIDQRVLKMALQLSRAQAGPLAINLSNNVFSDAFALAEFEQFVQDFSNIEHACLHVEVGHHILNQHPTATQHVASLLRRHGFGFGIEQLDLGRDLELIRQLSPQYIKINARRLDDLILAAGETPLRALHTLAQTLDIILIAVGVENDDMHRRLQQAGFEMMLGHIICPVVDHL